jgi:hypothetical protein
LKEFIYKKVTNTKEQHLSSIQYQVPRSTIQLPSEGILYPIESPLAKGSVDIHHMTAREEDILSSRNLLKQGRALDELLQSCIETTNVNGSDILSCDRNALFVAIRISGFGQDYPINVTCTSCAKNQIHNVDLSTLNARTPSEIGTSPLTPNTNLFECTLPQTKLLVRFKFLTGRDEQVITQHQDKIQQVESNNKNHLLTVQNEKEITLRMKQMIVSINDETNVAVLSDTINSLPTRDSRAFRKYVESIEPGLEMKSNFVCKYCMNEEVVDIPISTEFFWPPL